MSRPIVKMSIAGLLLAVAALLAFTLPVGRPITVSGQVRCVSGSSIVGIWVEASSGGSGWAVWTPQERRPSSAVYKYRLPIGGKYSLHVGCGGTPANWATSNRSASDNGPIRNLVCVDAREDPQFQLCRSE